MTQCMCGKTIDKVPDWLATVKVTFVCNNCPNRTVKSIAQVQLEAPRDPNSVEGSGAIEGAFDDEEETEEDES